MELSFSKKEHYLLITLKKQQLDKELKEKVMSMATQYLKKGEQGVVLLAQKSEASPLFWEMLNELHELVLETNGIFIFAKPPDAFVATLDESEILYTPSLDEAVDYLYMEKLERDLLAEEDPEQNPS